MSWSSILYYLGLFWDKDLYVAQASLGLTILLPQPPPWILGLYVYVAVSSY